MTIKFGKDVAEIKSKLELAIEEGDTDKINKMTFDFFDAFQRDIEKNVLDMVSNQNVDNAVLAARGNTVLTSVEKEFFNTVIEEGGFKSDKTLPETTIERVFDDLTQEHPLLKEIGIVNFGAVTKYIFGNPTGAATWGNLFGEIQGKLNTTFTEEQVVQMKLTAFFPISKDMLVLGPIWVERYIRMFLTEAIAFGLEKGFVEGTGDNQPIGLLRNPDKSEKTATGTLTFAPDKVVGELYGVMKHLAKDKKDKPRNIAGKVVMVVNPFDIYDITAAHTMRSDSTGEYITRIPTNPTIVESSFVPEGKIVFFVKGEYLAGIAGSTEIKHYQETLALEDADLYIAKLFAFGKPKDKKTSAVYTLQIAK